MRILARALEAGCLVALVSGCSELLGLDQYGVQLTESECADEECRSALQPGQVVGLETIGKVFEPTIDVDEAADAGPHDDGKLQPAARNAGQSTPDGGMGGATSSADPSAGGTSTDGGRTSSAAQCSTDDDCAGNAAGTSCVTSGPLKGACAACDPGDNSGCAWPNGRCDPETPSCGPPPSCAGLDPLCAVSSAPANAGYGGAPGSVQSGMGASGPTGPGPLGPGPSATPVDQDCCSSPLVSGGTFNRSNDLNHPANLTSFRLDRFEVVVGRFQRFVNAWVSGYRPSAGDGKHAHLNTGTGLVETGGGYESGWDERWTDNLATTATGWDANLSCEPTYSTWPANTFQPQTCVTWYEAYAFCIWDGGFLPTEAEWNYAAAGGPTQRQYPWGDTIPSADGALAAYGCYYRGLGTCSGVANIAPAGSISAGNGMFGQSDLAGNVWEWSLDWYSTSYSSASCDDCVDSSPSQHRVRRGGSFRYSEESLASSFRGRDAPMNRRFDGGFRCARAP
jgi:formylglycine-generating enzyme